MKNVLVASAFLLVASAFAQRNDAIRDTRVGGVREDTIKRAQEREDPEVRTEIIQTSKETGIGRGKLLKDFHSAQQKYASFATHLRMAGVPSLNAQQFHQAKVASVKYKLS